MGQRSEVRNQGSDAWSMEYLSVGSKESAIIKKRSQLHPPYSLLKPPGPSPFQKKRVDLLHLEIYLQSSILN